MAQPADIQLDGVNYMVLPGSYRRRSAGEPEGRGGRWTQTDFIGGQRRAMQLERDTGWDGLTVGPAMRGQGVEPWPYQTTSAEAAISSTPGGSRPARSAIVGGYAYIAIGQYVYETVALSASAWSPMTRVVDLGAGNVATDVCAHRGELIICCGATKDIQKFAHGGAAAAWKAGAKGNQARSYAGQLVWSDASVASGDVLKMTTGGTDDTRILDAPILNMSQHAGKLAIATRQSLYLLGGKGDATKNAWTTDPEPIYTGGTYADDNDYRVLASFNGKLYAFIAGQLMEWNPDGNRSQRWTPTGIGGNACYGACVAGDRLVVAVAPPFQPIQLWTYDGVGWWCIKTGSTVIWPVYLGGAGNFDVGSFRSGQAAIDLHRLVFRSATDHTYPTSGRYLTALIDAGERDKIKAWRRFGMSFASPETRGNGASTDLVTATLYRSIDGGQTFSSLGNLTSFDPLDRVKSVAFDPGGGSPESSVIQLMVEWTSVLDWAPTLTGLWIDYELLEVSAKKRRWSLDVMAKDDVVRRDGQTNGSGALAVANLWASWATHTTLTLRDIDYDLVPTQRSVRIAGIDEKRATPSDAGKWADAVVHLDLIEV